MNCISCKSPILPAFKFSLKANMCPSCGGQIMNDATVNLLDEIKEAFEKMPNDPEGLAGWLLTNYEMRKIGSAEPISEFYGNSPSRSGNFTNMSKEEQLRNNPKVVPNRLQEFYRKAGMAQKDLGSIADSINEETEYQESIPEAEDPEYTKAVLSSCMNTGEVSESELSELSSLINNSYQEDYDPSLPPALNAQRMERLRKQQEFQAGAKIGSFKRGF